jgi:arylsulfatase
MNEPRSLSCWSPGLLTLGLAFTFASLSVSEASAQEKKPNIVVIWGDDIGMWNVGPYTHGMMGRTPNIDRIAKEGMLFTDHYGQPSSGLKVISVMKRETAL